MTNNHKKKSVLTTGQVAKICNVAPRTVSKWFDSGQLRGYRIPGSKDRRIPVDQLVRFMKSHGMPTEGVETGSIGVLIVDEDTQLADLLSEALSADGTCETYHAATAFEAGALVERHRPDVMIVDVSAPDVDPVRLCRALRAHESQAGIRLIAISGRMTEGQGQSLLQSGFHGFLGKPFDVRQLRELIEKVTA
ncbi:MAG TPA: response regulator [Phycisphaerae bacterium]|nr:response regulator [Phycisphaerales bacterium]HRX84015.1 response regulator [Phycisphaerae bacterium]